MRRALLTAGLVFSSTLVWAVRLVTGSGPWASDAAAVFAADLLLMSAVAVVGMLVAGSGWARRLGWGLGAAGLALGVVLPLDPVWAVALTGSGLSLAVLAGRWLDGAVRQRPAADGPPGEAVVLALGLLCIPGLVALASPAGLGLAEWLAVGTGLVGAALYSKAGPGALLAVRALIPAGLALTAVTAGTWPTRLVILVAAVGLGWLGWRRPVRLAARPLITPGRPVRIPSELVPIEVLDAARIDRRGRPT